MKLRTFRVLCCLCALHTFVLSEEIDWENQFISKSGHSPNTQETEGTLNANIPRDKRALGLILSGLAQVFGYTVNPVQIATLPNSNSEDEARANQSSSNSSSSSNSTRANGSSTTAAPKQRETIRFTGVLNFGNSTGLLGHLQQYENLFHGQNGSSNTTANQPPAMPSSMMQPQLNPRTPMSNQSMLPPLLVKIPLPAIEERLPLMPKLPLPEIPPQDIQLSYPEPLIPVRNEQQTMSRNNATTERMMVQSKQVNDGKQMQLPPLPTEEPQWKKEHEERLSELERKQEEQAYKLRQQEWYRNHQKDENSSDEGYRNRYDAEKERNYGSENSGCRNEEKGNFKDDQSSEEVDHRSKQRYENEERNEEYPTSHKPTKSQEEDDEDEEKYRDYKNDDYKYKQYQDTPETSENYTSIQYSEPLPLSEDDEQRRPEELRNSYGEPLGNRELFDEGFLNYFSKFKEPLTDFYSSIAPQSSKEETSKEAEDSHSEDEDKSKEKVAEVDDVPARNKYEEYSLEEETNTRRQDGNDSNEDTSEPSLKYSNNISTNGKNRSYFEEKKIIEEMDFSKYMPFIVPVRYLNAPDELKKVKSRFSAGEKSPKVEATKRISVKEPYRPKKENSKGIVSPLERYVPKKLHESEQKELQVWPPPFDFVVDSTIHTNVVRNAKVTHEKPESADKRNKRIQDRGRRLRFDNSTQKSHDTSENIVYQRLKNNPKDEKVPDKRLITKRTNESTEAETARKKEEPDIWKRYKYTMYNNDKNTERPNIEAQLDKKKLDITKPTEKTEYYTELHSEENKNRKTQDGEVVQGKPESTSTFDPTKSYNFFDFDENPYGLDYGTGNERLGSVFEDSRKVENERAIGLTMPRQDVYRYDESLTKFASEPESRDEKVASRDYGNAATTMRVTKQEWISPNRPISYVYYTRVL